MDSIFKQFGKIERTEQINQEGIGMGLTICQAIIRNCNGHISCFSEGENKGSTFSFSMKMGLPDLDYHVYGDKKLLGDLKAEV